MNLGKLVVFREFFTDSLIFTYRFLEILVSNEFVTGEILKKQK